MHGGTARCKYQQSLSLPSSYPRPLGRQLGRTRTEQRNTTMIRDNHCVKKKAFDVVIDVVALSFYIYNDVARNICIN